MFNILNDNSLTTEEILARAGDPMWRISPSHHAHAVAVAAERARQEMFEACVKADCLYCKNDTPKQEGAYWIHYGRQNCHALALRRAFPERSAAMNARA